MATPSCSNELTDCASSSSDSSGTTRICILHVDQPEKQSLADILLFKPEQWTSVTQAASRRKLMKNFDKSKYYRVVQSLPTQPISEHGYHVSCYKNFTAVSHVKDIETPSTGEMPSSKHLRSATDFSSPSTSGIFPKKCLFCNKARKKRGSSEERLGACETKQAEATIKEAARVKNDNKFLAVISGVDFVAKEVMYHHSCKSAYIKCPKPVLKDREKTQIGLEGIYSYIERSVILNKRPELLTSIYAQYVEMCEDVEETPITTAQNLLRNIINKFGERLRVQCQSAKKTGSILYAEGLAEETVRAAYDYVSSAEARIRKAALELRKAIKDVKRAPLGDPPTLQNLRSGEASPPDLLLTFYRALYGGPNTKLYSPKLERRASSSSQDALYIVHNGHVKPGKQIILGMAIKSMTGSKKIVQILNRFGHIIDYSAIEELETALGEAIQNKQQACPEGTIDNVVMGLAFDNFDEQTETLSGADTLHDTMGILYQNKVHPSQTGDTSGETVPQPCTSARRSRKRKLDVHDHPLEPYRKKPRMTTFQYVLKTADGSRPDDRPQAIKKDVAWMMCHALGISNIPMWVGFNSWIEPDDSTEQVVLYMKNLSQPITNLDVIQETLATTQKCAHECGQQYGVVTYDLNAAKPAMQIQVTESPRYDDLFIMLGPFHVEMAFFKAIGKVIDESGGPRILTDCDVLAPGSLNGLITGKHFNRCKRMHPILALAFEILHFQAFLATLDGNDELVALLRAFERAPDDETPPDAETWQSIESSDIFTSCVAKYEDYTRETRSGEHGATAQFWITYVDYIHDFHNVERAIRTNDIDLFTHALTPFIQLFFATNHINYSRWLSKFQLDLVNIDNTHPGLRVLLQNGAFTVKRTGKSFSRSPVDLTLEQTVNADAASRRTGLSSATNNYSARLRWMITKSARAAVIAAVQELAGMSNREDTTAELHRSRIKRDTSDLQKVIEQIKGCCDPFLKSSEVSPSLFNIRTGKVTNEPIKECLLGLREKGKVRHKEFLESCFEDPNNFERSIKKEKLLTFKENCKSSKKSKDKQIASLVCSRDLMGRLLVLACKQELDLKHVLSYPLTTVPLSMCSTDGLMVKTEKSALLHLLEDRVERSAPTTVDATIIDGNFFMRTLPPHLPGTYGGLAMGILQQMANMSGNRVDIVFDAYPIPSIKESERARRGLGEKEKREYVISGAEQKRPKNIGDCLQSRSFKEELPKFLAEEWMAPHYASLINCKHMYLSYLGACFHFYVQGDSVVREVVDDLKTNHEEADTLICALIKSMDDGTIQNTVVRASDTDIAVIMVHHSWNIRANVWMDVGTSARNDRRYINLTEIGKTIGKKLSDALPAFHSFTGSDYTSAFVRKGKVRPFTQLEKDSDAQTAFAEMAKGNLGEKTTQAVMSFTARMYGSKAKGAALSLDAHRHQVFEKSFGPKSLSKDPLEKLKGIDSTLIPPCKAEISQHIRRASFVARMWANADVTDIQQHPTEDDGWELQDGSYEISWFNGPQLPEALVPDEETTNEYTDEDFHLSSSDEEEDLPSSEENGQLDD